MNNYSLKYTSIFWCSCRQQVCCVIAGTGLRDPLPPPFTPNPPPTRELATVVVPGSQCCWQTYPEA